VSTVLLAAETAWPYVAAAYVITLVVLIAYIVSILVRGRRIGRQVPADERRWSK